MAPLKFVEKLFFNKGLNGFNKRSDSLGTGDKQDLFLKKCSDIFSPAIFWTKNIGLPKILATIVNLPNIAGALNNLEKIGHNSEPRH